MAEKTKKPQPKSQLEKWANKSWKPFLIMVIIGAVCATVAIVFFVLMYEAALPYPEGAKIPADIAAQILIYMAIGAGFNKSLKLGITLSLSIPKLIIQVMKISKAKTNKTMTMQISATSSESTTFIFSQFGQIESVFIMLLP